MPNKKRRNKNAPTLDFELPPTTLAKATNLSSTKSRLRAKRSRHSKNTFENEDDTPKAFKRLMAFASGTHRLPKGPDNGRPPLSSSSSSSSSKRKRTATTATTAATTAAAAAEKTAAEKLTINPGESLREFNRRVDASLPIPLKVAREPRKPRNPPAPPSAASAAPPPQDGNDDGDFSDGGSRKRGRRRGASPDPWAVLETKRDAPRFGDVAAAPPSLRRPEAVLHSRGIADVDGVPRGAGSLARREGLAVERRELVEAYRKMMQGKRAGGGLD